MHVDAGVFILVRLKGICAAFVWWVWRWQPLIYCISPSAEVGILVNPRHTEVILSNPRHTLGNPQRLTKIRPKYFGILKGDRRILWHTVSNPLAYCWHTFRFVRVNVKFYKKFQNFNFALFKKIFLVEVSKSWRFTLKRHVLGVTWNRPPAVAQKLRSGGCPPSSCAFCAGVL